MLDIVGAMAPTQGKAVFARCSLVSSDENGLLGIHRYTDGFKREALTSPEWTALLDQGEAQVVLHPPPFEPGLRLWVFRPGFTLPWQYVLRGLRWEDRLVADWDPQNTPAFGCFVRDAGSAALRRLLSQAAFSFAEEAMARGAYTAGFRYAHTAFHLEPVMTLEVTELLARACELIGNSVRAEGYRRSFPR